jgi:nitrite reductase/ring-hydroxylating ferredoxin subunit
VRIRDRVAEEAFCPLHRARNSARTGERARR